MSAAILPTDAIYAGDTWPGLPQITIRINSDPPSDALASASLIFYLAEKGPLNPALTLTSEEEISITDDANWVIETPAQALALPPGEWTFRFALTDAEGVKRTYLIGTLTIL